MNFEKIPQTPKPLAETTKSEVITETQEERNFLDKTIERTRELMKEAKEVFHKNYTRGAITLGITFLTAGAPSFGQSMENQSLENESDTIEVMITEKGESLTIEDVKKTFHPSDYEFSKAFYVDFAAKEIAFDDYSTKNEFLNKAVSHKSAWKMIPEEEIQEGLTLDDLAAETNNYIFNYYLGISIENDKSERQGRSNYDSDFLLLDSPIDCIAPNGKIIESGNFPGVGSTKQEAFMHAIQSLNIDLASSFFCKTELKDDYLKSNKGHTTSSSFLDITKLESYNYFDSIEIISIEKKDNKYGEEEYFVKIKCEMGDLVSENK